MALLRPERIMRHRSGTYLGILASAYVSLFLAGLLGEQLGVSQRALDLALFFGPLAIFAGVGLLSTADDGRDFFCAGRSVSAYYTGVSLAVTVIGGVGVVCVTGALFKIGMDAIVLLVGWVSGLVLAGVMLFPFLRKCGAYSVPSYLGLRFDSRAVRTVAAVLLILPTLAMVGAELRVGAFIGSWITGWPEGLVVIFMALLATLGAVSGGMRGLTWSSVGEIIAVLLAMAVPATIVSLLISNLPIPQLMHGNLVRAFMRMESEQAFAPLHAKAFAFEMPGSGLEAFAGPYMQSFGHVGRAALPLAIMVIASGLAALPAVLNKAGVTTSVYEARKSTGWAVFFAAFMLLTLASVAGFMHAYVAQQVIGAPGDRMPIWFQTLEQMGLADVVKTQAAVGLAGVQIKRDAAFVTLPMAAGLPHVLVTLSAMGALAAALAGASAHIAALGGILSEDLLHGQRREPPADKERLRSARLAIAVAGGIGVTAAWLVGDPLAAVLAALALSSATGFPVLVLSIMWRKVSRFGAIMGMMTGFGVTAVLMFGAAIGMISISPLVAAAIGGPLNLIVMAVLSQAAPSSTRRALEVVRDIRVPGGEATYDRELRLQRRKRAA